TPRKKLIQKFLVYCHTMGPFFPSLWPQAQKFLHSHPAIAQSWRRNWDHVVPFFAYPAAVRRIIYTTNAIEALNSKLRRAIRARGHFPNDDAAMKMLYLVLNQAAGDWKRPPREWFEAKTQFAVVFGERFIIQ
ncbi:transposase, partial [Brucella sp. 191011898]|uniref:transposase n=1 Tax=Brucella sp. 191011898 TaxID=2730447 RepID=UPI001FCE79EE